jgi:hypothetical protein
VIYLVRAAVTSVSFGGSAPSASLQMCYKTGKLCANDDISRALTDSGQLPVSLGCVSGSVVNDMVSDTIAAVNDSSSAMDNACCGERPQAGWTHTLTWTVSPGGVAFP